MTASSEYNSDYQAAYGRLNGNRGDGWCTLNCCGNQEWLQVDLGKTFEICGAATQGDIVNQGGVTEFKLSYSDEGSTWTTYLDDNSTEMVRFYLSA